jgi:Flp pilus assembly protein TadG
MLEFGLCMSVLFFMIVGIFEYAQMQYASNFCSYAAQQAGRYAAIRGAASVNPLTTNPSPCGTSCTNPSSGDATTTYVKNMAVTLNPANITVTTNWSASSGNGNAAGGTVKVTVKYAYSPFFSIIDQAPTINLASTSTMQVLQ